MMFIESFWHNFTHLLFSPMREGVAFFLLKFVPFVLFFEMPVYLFIFFGVLKYSWRRYAQPLKRPVHFPSVSCIVTCYAEGEDVRKTIISMVEQIYSGR